LRFLLIHQISVVTGRLKRHEQVIQAAFMKVRINPIRRLNGTARKVLLQSC
jgi:hypothetical protein